MLTREQREMRRTGVSASSAAAVIGVDPWRGPLDVYADILAPGLVADISGPHIDRGNFLEPALVAWAASRLGLDVAKHGAKQETVRHPDEPLVLATPDGILLRDGQPVAVLEVKAPSWRSAYQWGEDGSDEIPDRYYVQVQWQMFATGLRMAYVAALIGDELRIYRIELDAALCAKILAKVKDFWSKHIEAGVPPQPDGHERQSKLIEAEFPRSDDEMLKADDETIGDIVRYTDAEMAHKKAAARLEAAKQRLKMRIGPHAGISSPVGRVSWRVSRGRQKTDWEAIAKERGATEDDINKHTSRSAGYRVFRVTYPRG